jgi:hypothetical protein
MPSTVKGLRDESIAREKVEGSRRAVTGSTLETVIVNVSGTTTVGGDLTGTVSNAQIAAGAVTDTELASNAVTNAKVANDAINTAEIVNDAVTNAKLAEMAAHTLKVNITGSTANPTDESLAAVLNAELGNTQGQVAYHNGTAWVALAPGTSGHFLKTNGAGANPAWAAGGGGGGAFTDLTDVPSAYTGHASKVVRVNSGETALEFTTGAPPSGAASGDLAGTYPAPTVKSVTGPLALPNTVSATVSGNLTDYAPTSHASASRFLLTVDSSGPYELRSLAGGDEGRILVVYNVGTTALTVKDNYTSGTTAGMRFDLVHDLVLYPGESMIFQYDAGVSRWRVLPMYGLKITSGGAELARRLDIANTATVDLALSTLTNGVTELTASVNNDSITTAKLNDGAVTAAKLATGVIGWTTLSATADQAVINNSTPTNSTYLQFSMAASTKYRIRFYVMFDCTAAGDFKYTLSGPASPTLVHIERLHVEAGGTSPARGMLVAYPANVALTGTGTAFGYVKADMIVHNGSNAGTFSFQFSQNSAQSDAGAIVLAGSYMEYSIA